MSNVSKKHARKQESPTHTFKIGDMVVYRSGGPKMVVMMAKEWIQCDWFDANGVFHRDIFIPALLKKVPSD